MAILSRDEILNAQDLKTEEIQVPEWFGSVLVRALTGSERDQFEQAILIRKGKDTTVNLRNARAKLVVMSVVDAAGKRLFSDADVAILGRKSAIALQRVFEAATRLSGISEEDLEELTDELQENPFGDSPSA